MDHYQSSVELVMPDAYASALEYVSATLTMSQGELVVFLMQVAANCQLEGEPCAVGVAISDWLVRIKKVPVDEVEL